MHLSDQCSPALNTTPRKRLHRWQTCRPGRLDRKPCKEPYHCWQTCGPGHGKQALQRSPTTAGRPAAQARESKPYNKALPTAGRPAAQARESKPYKKCPTHCWQTCGPGQRKRALQQSPTHCWQTCGPGQGMQALQKSPITAGRPAAQLRGCKPCNKALPLLVDQLLSSGNAKFTQKPYHCWQTSRPGQGMRALQESPTTAGRAAAQARECRPCNKALPLLADQLPRPGNAGLAVKPYHCWQISCPGQGMQALQ